MKLVKYIFLTICLFVLSVVFIGCNSSSKISDNQQDLKSETNTETNTDEPNMKAGLIENESKILVAYFSCTGNTKSAAEKISAVTGGDLYEIVPKVPYTNDDLDYGDDNSRSTVEMNDESVRPEIDGSVESMSDYDVVYLGYPIWWGEAPRIIDTFLESYNFSGKTIVPFCTSGGSGINSSTVKLHSLCSDMSKWDDGKRITGGESEEELKEWIESLDMK